MCQGLPFTLVETENHIREGLLHVNLSKQEFTNWITSSVTPEPTMQKSCCLDLSSQTQQERGSAFHVLTQLHEEILRNCHLLSFSGLHSRTDHVSSAA